MVSTNNDDFITEVIDSLVIDSVNSSISKKDKEDNIVFAYLCDHCGYKTNNENKCETHMDFHDDLTYQCDKCSYKTSVQSELMTHVKSSHIDLAFSCNYC